MTELRTYEARTAADGCEIGCWREIAKRLMLSVVVEAAGEGVDERLQLVDAVRQVERRVNMLKLKLGLFHIYMSPVHIYMSPDNAVPRRVGTHGGLL